MESRFLIQMPVELFQNLNELSLHHSIGSTCPIRKSGRLGKFEKGGNVSPFPLGK